MVNETAEQIMADVNAKDSFGLYREQAEKLRAFLFPSNDSTGDVMCVLREHGAVTLKNQLGRVWWVEYASTRSEPLPTWAQLAPDLLGIGKPLEDFRLYANHVFLVFKTEAQTKADTVAHSGDVEFSNALRGTNHVFDPNVAHGPQSVLDINTGKGYDLNKFLYDLADGRLAPVAVESGAPPQRKPEVRGVARLVLDEMQTIAPNGKAIDLEKLKTAAVKKMPKKLDGRGHDRRRDHAGRAIDQLVEKELLFVHDDGDKVSLTAILHGGEEC